MSLEKSFNEIFKENGWNHHGLTVSGGGSTLEYTENLRKQLPLLIEDLKIESILDAPCGDFNWMKEILPILSVEYIGGDIVEELVKTNKEKYSNATTKFVVLDITKDKLPDAELMICRDCLFHLHPNDVIKFFQNFLSANIPFLLTSTHINLNNSFTNVRKLRAGDFKKIDLFSSPYNLSRNTKFNIKDYIEGYPPREMVLFEKHQIEERFSKER